MCVLEMRGLMDTGLCGVCLWVVCMLCVGVFIYTKFDVALHGEQNVSSLQVSVNDVVLMQITQSLKCLETHLTDLLL